MALGRVRLTPSRLLKENTSIRLTACHPKRTFTPADESHVSRFASHGPESSRQRRRPPNPISSDAIQFKVELAGQPGRSLFVLGGN